MLSFVVVWFVIRKKYSAWYSSSQCSSSSSSSSPYHPLIPPLSFRSCPVPLTYARHTSRFLSMFCLTAPIALVGELGNTHVHTCNYICVFDLWVNLRRQLTATPIYRRMCVHSYIGPISVHACLRTRAWSCGCTVSPLTIQKTPRCVDFRTSTHIYAHSFY